MIRLDSAVWACRDCPEHGTGTQAAVDKAAVKHSESKTGPKHTTATWLSAPNCALCGDPNDEPADCPDRHGWEDHCIDCAGACPACQHRLDDE